MAVPTNRLKKLIQPEPAPPPEWCLICAQRPAEGVMRRVFVDSRTPVVLDEAVPQPHVCQKCGDQYHGVPAEPIRHPKHGKMITTMWDFVLERPA